MTRALQVATAGARRSAATTSTTSHVCTLPFSPLTRSEVFERMVTSALYVADAWAENRPVPSPTLRSEYLDLTRSFDVRVGVSFGDSEPAF